jgi:hypothetical protein
MNKTAFQIKLKQLQREHEQLIKRRNRPQKNGNGIFDRYEFPVLTAGHAPLFWRYDFNPADNPHLMTRLGINCAFNVGAMEWNGNVVLMARTEGWDRKSFFAVAEWMDFVIGIIRSACRSWRTRKQTFTTCAWCATRTGGFTGCSAPSAMTTPSRATFPPPSRVAASPARKTSSNGNACPTLKPVRFTSATAFFILNL